MQPHEVYEKLKRAGVKLTIRDGKLRGPRTLTAEQRQLVKDNRDGLIVCLTYQCPVRVNGQICNQPIRMFGDYPDRWVIECTLDPAHYSETFKKNPEQVTLGLIAEHDPQCPCNVPEDLGW